MSMGSNLTNAWNQGITGVSPSAGISHSLGGGYSIGVGYGSGSGDFGVGLSIPLGHSGWGIGIGTGGIGVSAPHGSLVSEVVAVVEIFSFFGF